MHNFKCYIYNVIDSSNTAAPVYHDDEPEDTELDEHYDSADDFNDGDDDDEDDYIRINNRYRNMTRNAHPSVKDTRTQRKGGTINKGPNHINRSPASGGYNENIGQSQPTYAGLRKDTRSSTYRNNAVVRQQPSERNAPSTGQDNRIPPGPPVYRGFEDEGEEIADEDENRYQLEDVSNSPRSNKPIYQTSPRNGISAAKPTQQRQAPSRQLPSADRRIGASENSSQEFVLDASREQGSKPPRFMPRYQLSIKTLAKNLPPEAFQPIAYDDTETEASSPRSPRGKRPHGRPLQADTERYVVQGQPSVVRKGHQDGQEAETARSGKRFVRQQAYGGVEDPNESSSEQEDESENSLQVSLPFCENFVY